jgi:hypothetical protein
VKLEIINNFVGICREFLSFEEEKEFDWIAGEKVLRFSTDKSDHHEGH